MEFVNVISVERNDVPLFDKTNMAKLEINSYVDAETCRALAKMLLKTADILDNNQNNPNKNKG